MDVKRHISSGGIVYKLKDGSPFFLLLEKSDQGWVTPKGHIEGNETPEETAKREVAEEAGLKESMLRITTKLGTLEYAFEKDGFRHEKIVHVYLIEDTAEGDPRPQGEEGFSNVGYFPYEEALSKLAHENMKKFFFEAWEFLKKN